MSRSCCRRPPGRTRAAAGALVLLRRAPRDVLRSGAAAGPDLPGRQDRRGGGLAESGTAAALGHTRAAALEALGSGCGTTELARRVGVSPASSSEHLKVLRDAGLVMSHRDGQCVLHRPTRLGRALLDGH
ncbi:ArsR/SmtB family transcription factor [Actinorhabdospora filicis]|uniref:ArsR/SmtB family transcription factor n=1 Tax=Actinorhabdospora filicis TaxID=1785913 RepID=UPI002556F2B3|nr:helix-turn-helix domain-containing protein [Actinorhabdospora filicis]